MDQVANRDLDALTDEELDILERQIADKYMRICLLYTSPSPRDRTRSRMPSSA